MGYYATEWLYGTAPAIPTGTSHNVGAAQIHRVLGFLCHRADDDTGEACPSQATIGAALNMHRRDVGYCLEALVALGHITCIAPPIQRVRGTVYRLELAGWKGGDIPAVSEGRGKGGDIPAETPRERAGKGRGKGGDIPARSLDQLPNSNSSPGSVVARAAAADDSAAAFVQVPLDRVREILEASGAPARLTGRAPQPAPGEPPAGMTTAEHATWLAERSEGMRRR